MDLYPIFGLTMSESEHHSLDTENRRRADDHSIRIALLEQSTESIRTQLQAINGNMSKLVWLVFSALIVAVLKLVLVGA